MINVIIKGSPKAMWFQFSLITSYKNNQLHTSFYITLLSNRHYTTTFVVTFLSTSATFVRLGWWFGYGPIFSILPQTWYPLFFLLPLGKPVDGGRHTNEAIWGGISQYALSPTGYTLSEYASVNLIRKLRELDKSTTKKEKWKRSVVEQCL